MIDLLKVELCQLEVDINSLKDRIRAANTPAEGYHYQQRLIASCEQLLQSIQPYHQLLGILHLRPDALPNVMGKIREFKTNARLLSFLYAPPVLRATSDDRLSLKITNWLHSCHASTQHSLATVDSGNWSVYPYPRLDLIVYKIPVLEQNRLLHMPLLFHEFGHVLYPYHKRELNDLIRDFQKSVVELLSSGRKRNDRYNEKKKLEHQAIAHTWFKWMNELYCDAVGFEIGGASYLLAFASYLRNFAETDFRLSKNDLLLSSHPITWLRVQVLASRAKTKGFDELAASILSRWKTIADVLEVTEDYYGYYHEYLSGELEELLGYMVVEANPNRYSTFLDDGDFTTYENPVKLFDIAWKNYLESPLEYPRWEAEAIQQFLAADYIIQPS